MRHRKFFLALLLLLIGGAKVWGQGTTNYPYVFTYTASSGGTTTTYYLGTDLSRPDAFDPDKCIWWASGTIGGTSRNINNGSQYMNGTTTDKGNLTLGRNANNFRSGGHLGYYSSRYYYVYYDNGWKCSRNSGTYGSTRVVPYSVATDTHEGSQTSPKVSGDALITSLGTKSYSRTDASDTKGYTKYTFDDHDHYWYDGEDHEQEPQQSSGSFTYRWGLSANMTGYATVDQNGVVSYTTAVPEYQRAGMLWCEAENNTRTVLCKKLR